MMITETDFKTGNRARHVKGNKTGTVTVLPDGSVQVAFDVPAGRGRKNIGIYDPNWFRVHPNGLVPATGTGSVT